VPAGARIFMAMPRARLFMAVAAFNESKVFKDMAFVKLQALGCLAYLCPCRALGTLAVLGTLLVPAPAAAAFV
jgi:hypothetical protein